LSRRSKLRLRYRYEMNGINGEGEQIPDIPVVYLVLESQRARARGPAVVDTGFDGGVYPNIQVVRILEGMRPEKIKNLDHPLYGLVPCEVFRVKASLLDPSSKREVPLGLVNVYTPVEPEFLADEVLIGREVLNKLRLELDGEWVVVECSHARIEE